MSGLSAEKTALSHKMHSLFLRSLDETGQTYVAQCLGIDPSTVSRKKEIKNCGLSDLQLFCHMAACCGLKLVPADQHAYDKKTVDALVTLSKGFMQGVDNADDLFSELAP